MKLRIKHPGTAPSGRNDPIQPAMSVDIGPSSSGLFFDINNGSAGDSHPIFKPRAKNRMFAIRKEGNGITLSLL